MNRICASLQAATMLCNSCFDKAFTSASSGCDSNLYWYSIRRQSVLTPSFGNASLMNLHSKGTSRGSGQLNNNAFTGNLFQVKEGSGCAIAEILNKINTP